MDRYYQKINIKFFTYFLAVDSLWNDNWYLLANVVVAFAVFMFFRQFLIFFNNISIVHGKDSVESDALDIARRYLYSEDSFTKVLWNHEDSGANDIAFTACYVIDGEHIRAPVVLYKITQDKYHIREVIYNLLQLEHISVQILSSLSPVHAPNLVDSYERELQQIRLHLEERKREYDSTADSGFEIYLFLLNVTSHDVTAVNIADINVIYDKDGKERDFRWLVQQLDDKRLYNSLKSKGFFEYEQLY